MSSREISEWIAYFGLEPFGEQQNEWRAGMLASVMANTVRDDKKVREPYKPQDFMRELYLEKAEPDPQDLFSKAKGIFSMFKQRAK